MKKAAYNRGVYHRFAGRAKVLRDHILAALEPDESAPVILDLDGNVPYEHAIGLLNALKELDIHDIEWAGNPRFDRTFGR